MNSIVGSGSDIVVAASSVVTQKMGGKLDPVSKAKIDRVLTRVKNNALLAVAGTVAGAYLWKKHRVLGALSGFAVGCSAMPIVKDEDRKGALENIAATAVGVAAALKWKKRPAVAWLGGVVVSGIALREATKKGII